MEPIIKNVSVMNCPQCHEYHSHQLMIELESENVTPSFARESDKPESSNEYKVLLKCPNKNDSVFFHTIKIDSPVGQKVKNLQEIRDGKTFAIHKSNVS